MKMLRLLGLLVPAILSCSLLQPREFPVLNPNEVYKHDLKVRVNGVDYVGVGVLPKADTYNVEIDPPGKIDRIMWRTCNREEVIDKPDSGFFSNNKFKLTLNPVEMEQITACGALDITVLEEKKRRNGFAFFEFQDRREEVEVKNIMTCNGQVTTNVGVSICQSAAGLYQELIFDEPVKQEGSDPICDVMKQADDQGIAYKFQMPKGKCVYYFVAQSRAENGKRKLHRLTLIGYTDVPPIK